MTYSERVIADLEARYPEQLEFIQAAKEVLETLQPALDAHPEYEEASLLERIVEPERVIMFRVPWVDDNGKVQVNRGYRVEFNSAIGPCPWAAARAAPTSIPRASLTVRSWPSASPS